MDLARARQILADQHAPRAMWLEAYQIVQDHNLRGGDRIQKDFWTPKTAPEGDEPVVEPPTEDEA